MGFFEIGSCELFAQGWLQTMILLVSASLVTRITGTSHWCPAKHSHYLKKQKKFAVHGGSHL
jgi:hypothetical protein